MYRSKKDVDKHVEGLIAKLSLKEFKSRAYSVARLYYEVADYTSCQKYVEQYLSQKDNNAAAYKLLGQALQKLGQKEKALEQYKISLEIDPTQTSLILDICEILADDDVSVDPGRAKYWSEKAQATFPRHPVTFRLRERLMSSANPDPDALISLLTAEIQVRPKDPTLHARLLRQYLQSNKIKEAFEHSCSVEFGGNTFYNNIAWYETLAELLKHNSHDTSGWLYQLLLLTVRERVCTLSLTETPSGTSKSLVESNELLHLYDQALESVNKTGAPAGFAEFHTALLQHHRGQFALHAATFLLKKAKKDQLSWRDATKIASSLMLMAWHTVPLDTKVSWLSRTPEKLQSAVNRWYAEATYRCSQAGHYLLANIQDKTQSFLDVVSQLCSGPHWKDKLYNQMFNSRDHLAKIKTSHLVSDAFNSPTLRLPRKVEVEAYDADAQKQNPNSLHHFVWMLINYKNFAQFQCTLFEMLAPKSRNYLNCGPETLHKSDMLAFLFCAAQTAKHQKASSNAYESTQKPKVLPANITDLLCTLGQMKWWDCAYKFGQNQLGTELTDIRAILSRGIEVVRCVDNHGLDPELLCQLGQIFGDLAEKSTAVDDKTNFESRAVLYYNSAIPLLEKLKSRIVVKVPEKRLFDYSHKELSNKVLNGLLEESKVYVADNHIKECEYEKALEMLSGLKSPQAYYQLSQTYKKMAVDEQSVSKDNIDNEAKSKYATLLTKSRNYAYKTIDRLKDIHEDVKHPLFAETQELIEDIETQLNKIETDLSGTIIVNEVDGKYSSDENVSSAGSEHVTMHTNNHIFRNLSSTPKHPTAANATNYRTAVESQFFDNSRVDTRSLERIEKEIKNLQKRDCTISSFMEQTKSWFEENKNLGNQIISTINSNIQNTTDQFKLLKISVDQVKDQIDECRNECKDVGELKKQIAELKKEVNKLKKPEQNVDENDLYNIDEDYRSNDGASNFASQLPFPSPQVLPQFNQRLVPPFPMPPNPYQFYGQNLYNLYNQYSQFSQTTPVPGAPPLFDPARAGLNFAGVYATPEQMYPDMAHLIPPVAPPVPAMPPVPPVPVSAPPPVSQPISVSKPPAQPKDTARNLPVNVVITSSDPLPTATTAPQPVLSVTIPPKHIKGTPHNYQIQLPVTSDAQVKPPTIPGILDSSSSERKPFTSWNQANAFKAAFSAGTAASANATDDSLSFSFLNNSKSSLFDNSISVVDGNPATTASPNTSLNKSRTLSERSNTSVENYDPCPDFKPIVPLPAEVKVTTGEEDEITVFSARSKLFRFVDKQWKERGIGEIKLLKHKETGKVRVLMRREQVHKICANHLITSDIEIQPMKNENKAYFWVANDFADETVVLEKFCVRFKTPEIAKDFYEAFEKARQEAKDSPRKTETVAIPKPATKLQTPSKIDTAEKPTENQTNKTVVGGFTFSSAPTFKNVKEQTPEVKPAETPTTKANPFSALTFKPNTTSPFSNLFNVTNTQNNSLVSSSPQQQQSSSTKLNSSDTIEEFEPTAEFKPVVPLPALVDHKTGEEDETILFEHRAKLLRFESATKEWKERGLGNMKILVRKDNNQKLRLLMRREQVMKVCCNHGVTKEMTFEKMPNMDKAVTWCAKDFSEGELQPETFCLRFKTVQICDEFITAVKAAQLKLNDETKAAKEEENAAKQSNQTTGFGDKFKPKSGSWQCDGCYTNNLESFAKCACCEQPNPQGGKEANTAAVSAATPNAPLNWGQQFKPKAGTWECKECYIRNDSSVQYCNACNSPKDPSMPKKDAAPATGSSVKYSFGIPSQTAATLQVTKAVQPVSSSSPAPAVGWGDKFKPKVGSWECKQCFVRNEGSLDQCSACTSPKDPSAAKKEPQSLFGAPQSGPKFNFGIPAAVTPAAQLAQPVQPASIFDGTGAHKFSFGVPSTQESSSVTAFGIQTPVGGSSVIFATPKKPTELTPTPLNFSLKKNEDLTVTVTPVKSSLTSTTKDTSAFGEKEGGRFDFVFKPKTPAKGKSPIKSPKSEKGDESDDNEYASEDEGHHIHFSPVIPLPDKVEVVTGEENEDELYGHRAKLFRFVSGEWKERGIGNVKILKNKDTGKLRVLMRREQVLKICLNHALTTDIIYTPKEDKSWMFAANDFSDGELALQQFCLRFKTKEIATEFREAIDNALGGKTMLGAKESDSSDDVVFVKEIQATKEEKKRAKELMLPENFYTYKNKEPCQGCRGCEKKEDVKPPAPAATSAVASSSAIATPAKNMTPSFNSPAASAYGTPNNFDKTVDTSIFRTPLDSIGSNNNKSTPMFGFSNKTSNTTDKENTFKYNLFGGNGKSIFGVPPMSSETQTPTLTKSSILAAPKLSTDALKDSEKQTVEPKSLFGNASATIQKPLFGVQNATENKSLFGNANNANATENKSIFGTGKSIFDPANSNDAKSVFASAVSTPSTDAKSVFSSPFGNAAKSVFSSANSADNKPVAFGSANNNGGQSIFAQSTPFSNQSVFGNKEGDKAKPEVRSLFGGEAEKPANLFNSPVQGSLFGPAAANDQNKPAGNIFGSTGNSIFGNNVINAAPTFGSGKSLFGAANQSSDDAKTNKQKTDEKPIVFGSNKPAVAVKEGTETPFKVDNTLSFAALSSGGAGFTAQKKADFSWEGAGQQLFTAAQKAAREKERSKDDSGAGDVEDGDADAPEEYDPHYEPIVPLPDKIVVTTGEEDEQKMFGERCKLYRYDEKTKEWKERGIGEMKLLYHPERNSYRMLLRREQVHKAVLNMLLFPDLELLPMKNSDRAWTWAGRNYAEIPAGEQETLAVRFKSVDLAAAFHARVVECTRKVQAAAAQAIREQKETEKLFDTVAPLRLPKHLEGTARVDAQLAAQVNQSASSAVNSAQSASSIDRSGQSENGDVRAAEKARVQFLEPAAVEEHAEEEEEDYEHNYEDYENYEDYYNEEDEQAPYFICDGKVLVRQGDARTECEEAQIQVLYDQDLSAPKILVSDAHTGEVLADVIIYTETEFQMTEDSCTWTGMDFTSEPVEKTVTASFFDADTLNQFYDSCETSKASTYSSTDPES